MSPLRTTPAVALALLAAPLTSAALPVQAEESAYYTLQTFTPPDGAVLEVGGMDWLPDGRLALSTRRGQVWLVENALAEDVADARFHLFAEGLREGLGLRVVDGVIHVVQRGELSRLLDTDGDGRCDRVDTISNNWGLSGNYHEFAFGLPMDEQGNFYVSLNVSFFSPKWWHGKSPVPFRGWVLQIDPEGRVTPWAYGMRSPCGLGRNAAGDLFATDNQGDWVASSPIYHVQPGRFYGHPASLSWTPAYLDSGSVPSDEIPPAAAADRTPPAVWIPYKWSRSTGNLEHDPSGGAFGPFADQLFVAELTNGMVLRAPLEKVRGEYQGAVIPFRTELGSTARIRFAPDGSLMLGYTNRGWGGRAPADGLARLRWTGVVPLEMHHVALQQDGFRVTFTEPLAADLELGPEQVAVETWDYNYWWEYGSPRQHVTTQQVTAVELSEDRRTVTLRLADLGPAVVCGVTFAGLRTDDGRPLLHPEFAYTVNQLPEGEPTVAQVSKVVPPPPSKADAMEGWLRLTYSDATALWQAEGWELCEAQPADGDPTHFTLSEGNGALVPHAAEAAPMVSKVEIGDHQGFVEFQLAQGASAGVRVGGVWIELSDGDACGSVAGQAPARPAYQGPGAWQELTWDLQAPRFDVDGLLASPGVLREVRLNGELLHENLALSFGDPEQLAPTAALALRGDRDAAGFRGVRVRPLYDPMPTRGWEPIFPEEEFDDWILTGDAEWELDDDGTIVGNGRTGHLFSVRGDYRNFEARGRFRINDGGNSGFYFRVQPEQGWPPGYEAQINSNFPDPQKTGSLYSLAPIHTWLVPENSWFDYWVRCEEVEQGTSITIAIDGVVVTRFVDTERRHGPGHFAIQQHHEGSRIEARELFVRRLE